VIRAFKMRLAGLLAGTLMAGLFTGCNPVASLFPPPEAKLKGMWAHAFEGSGYTGLEFDVFYFDGKGNADLNVACAYAGGWMVNNLAYGCFSSGGTYSVSDGVLIINSTFYNDRLRYRVTNDRLYLSRMSNPSVVNTYIRVTEYPWVTYSDTTRFAHDNRYFDASFFSQFTNTK
jgi:hypothetical protein